MMAFFSGKGSFFGKIKSAFSRKSRRNLDAAPVSHVEPVKNPEDSFQVVDDLMRLYAERREARQTDPQPQKTFFGRLFGGIKRSFGRKQDKLRYHNVELIAGPLHDEVGSSQEELRQTSLARKKIIGARLDGKLYMYSDFQSKIESEPALGALLNNLRGGNSFRETRSVYRLGKSMTVDPLTKDLYVDDSFFGNPVKIGKVTSLDNYESKVFQKINDIVGTPKIHSIDLFAANAHEQALKAKKQMLKECEGIIDFVKAQGFTGEITPEALQEILQIQSSSEDLAGDKRYQKFIAKVSEKFKGVEQLSDSLKLFTEIESALEKQKDNFTLRDIELESYVENLSVAEKLDKLRELQEKISIRTPDFSDLQGKIKIYKEKGIISDVFEAQLEEYIKVTGCAEFNQKLTGLYKDGLGLLQEVFSMQEKVTNLPLYEKVQVISQDLVIIHSYLHEVNQSLSYSNVRVTDEVKAKLTSIQNLITKESDYLVNQYRDSLYELPFAAKDGSVDLLSASNFLSFTRGSFAGFADLAEEVSYLRHFAEKTGLGNGGQFDNLDADIKAIIINHYKNGSFVHPSYVSNTHEEMMTANFTEVFLSKIISPILSSPKLNSKDLNSLLRGCLGGDYALIMENFIPYVKKNLSSKEFNFIDNFVTNLALSGNHILTDLAQQDSEKEEFESQKIVMLQGIREAKITMLPFLEVNSLDSISLIDSLIALKEHGAKKLGKDYNLLLVQLMMLETKQEILREQEAEKDFSIEVLNQKFYDALIDRLDGLDEKTRELINEADLSKLGFDVTNIADLSANNNLVAQGFNDVKQVQTVISRLNAVGSVIGNNDDLKAILLKNLLKNDMSLLSNQTKQRVLSKLFKTNYIDSEQIDGVISSVSPRIKERIESKIGDKNIDKKSAVFLGKKMGRTLTNLNRRAWDNTVTLEVDLQSAAQGDGKSVMGMMGASKKSETVKYKLKKVSDVIDAFGDIRKKKEGLDSKIDQEREQLIYAHGVVLPTVEELDFYQKSLEEAGQGKTSARIINNYFLLKDERRNLVDIITNWNNLKPVSSENNLAFISSAHLLEILRNKQQNITDVWGKNLDGMLNAAQLLRVDSKGNINEKGDHLALFCAEYKSGLKTDKFCGFVDPSDANLLSSLSQMNDNIGKIVAGKEMGPKGSLWLKSLSGFDFKKLHRSSRNVMHGISSLRKHPTIEQLDELEKPENLHNLQTIKQRAYIKNVPDLQKITKKSNLAVFESNLDKLEALSHQVFTEASGSLKEASMVIHLAIMHGYDLLSKECPRVDFTAYISALLEDNLEQNFSLNLAADSPLKSRENLLTYVGVPVELDNLCLYELDKVLAATEVGCEEELLSWYEGISVSSKYNKLRDEIDLMQDELGLQGSRFNRLTNQIQEMKIGDKIMVGHDFTYAPVPTESLITMSQKAMTYGLTSLAPEFEFYKKSAFTIEKDGEGKVSLVINQDQGANMAINLSLFFDAIVVGTKAGYSLDRGVKFEFSGDNAEYDAVALARKLMTGKDFTVDDITNAQTVSLNSGVTKKCSSGVTAGAPTLLEALGIKSSRVSDVGEAVDDETRFYNYGAKFSAVVAKEAQHSVCERRGIIETTHSDNVVVRFHEDEGYLNDKLEQVGIQGMDMFYNVSTTSKTTEKNGYITGHKIIQTIALSDDASFANNEKEYLKHLYELVSANERDKTIIYDKKLINDLEEALHSQKGAKSIVVEREIKPEELQVINNKLTQLHGMEGATSSKMKHAKQELSGYIKQKMNDLSATKIADIGVMAAQNENHDVSSYKDMLYGVRVAKLTHVEKIKLKRFDEITKDPDLIAENIKKAGFQRGAG